MIVSPVSSFMHIEFQIREDSQQQLLLSLATHEVMLFITCKRLAQWHHSDNETYSAARKQNDQWVTCITPADFFIDNEGSLMTIKDILIQSISLQQLLRISVHFKIAGYRNRTKIIMITLIEKRLKTLDCRDMIGYNKKSSKEPKMYLKRNGAPFTPESSALKNSTRLKKNLKRTALPLLLNYQQEGRLLAYYYLSNFLLPEKILSTTQVQIPNSLLSNCLPLHLQILLI